MGHFARLLSSSVGGKILMALTGSFLVLFVIAHLAGNLLIFKGRESFNAYAQGLRDLGPLLWIARIGLLVFVLTHIRLAFQLSARNRAARKQDYGARRWLATTFESRFMLFGGLALLAFIVYHLAHFTFGWVQPSLYGRLDALGRPDAYGMVVDGFKNPVVAFSYVAAMVFLALHLKHGVASAFQTFGASHPRYLPAIRAAGPALAILLAGAFSSIPLAIFFGLVKAAA
jgi:succinate dehydrogenase / fumarate reductase cytochrome b subunit